MPGYQADPLARVNDHRWTAGEFIRRFEDANFSHCKMPKHMKRQDKKIVEAEALLWGSLWNALKRLPPVFTETGVSTPASLLFWIVNEHGLASFNYYEKIEGKEKLGKSGKEIDLGKSGIIRKHQSYNKALRSRKNPFDRDRYPETWAFIENSLVFADRSHDFYRNFYLKIIDARVEVLKLMDKSDTRCRNGEGVLENRGRDRM